MYSISVN